MSGVKGRSGRRPWKDGPRWPSGRLVYEWKDRCQCGQPKTKWSRQCLTCADRQRARPRCACGRRKACRSHQCQQCATQARRDHMIARVCEWCRREFKRKKRRPKFQSDVLRFCSKKCWGAFRTAESQSAQQTIRQAHSIQRELERAQRQYARSVCAWGSGYAVVRIAMQRVCARVCTALPPARG
jgi:hypothetical protein